MRPSMGVAGVEFGEGRQGLLPATMLGGPIAPENAPRGAVLDSEGEPAASTTWPQFERSCKSGLTSVFPQNSRIS